MVSGLGRTFRVLAGRTEWASRQTAFRRAWRWSDRLLGFRRRRRLRLLARPRLSVGSLRTRRLRRLFGALAAHPGLLRCGPPPGVWALLPIGLLAFGPRPFEPLPLGSLSFEPLPFGSRSFEPLAFGPRPFEPLPLGSLPFEPLPFEPVPCRPVALSVVPLTLPET